MGNPEISDLYMVDTKRQHDFPDKASYGATLQLQTGYSILNAHRHKIGINPSPLCDCGVPETTQHYLLECDLHTEHHEKLLKQLQKLCGVINLDT